MESKRQNIINKEILFKAIAEKPIDTNLLEHKLFKYHIFSSKQKYKDAFNSLLREGRIIVNGKEVSANASLLKQGKFIQSGKGGYVILEGDTHRYFLNKEDVNGARPNSNVIISFYQKQTKEGVVEVPFIVAQKQEVSQQAITLQEDIIYGRVMKSSHDDLIFLPNDKRRFKHPIFIGNDKKTIAKFQDKLCTMKIVDEEKGNIPAVGMLLQIKGEAGNPIAEYDTIAESHGANMGFSDEILQRELSYIPQEVDLTKYILCNEDEFYSLQNKKAVVDLRQLNFTTVDPADCKDMDDAIFSTFDEDGNIIIYVAVANVTKYVDLDSEIGRRYIQAGFTTYAPNKAYNILPPELSTNICSLNPNVDRLAYVVKAVIDKNSGKTLSYKIMDGVIKSKHKYSYEEAQAICDKSPISLQALKQKASLGMLESDEQVVMNMLASDLIWKYLKNRNIIEFNTENQYKTTLSPDLSDIIDIQKQEHIKYHKVIEAFMLVANEVTAEFALKNKIPNIYRVHDKPNEDKISQAFEFFSYLDIPFDGDLSPNSTKYILSYVKDTDNEKLVNNFLVRMQSKAKYSHTTKPEDVRDIRVKSNHKNQNIKHSSQEDKAEISHFGLQSQHYSHTTSPIRRITDYVTQYNILAFIKREKMLDKNTVRETALWANQMQDEVDCAEREIHELNSAIYCTHHLNEVMKGRICSIKKVAERKTSSAEDFVVMVENEDKGIRVEIPLHEILSSRGENSKNVTLSEHGCAIINKQTKLPIVTLSQELTFKITSSDRNTRRVTASVDLVQENKKHKKIDKQKNNQQENSSIEIEKEDNSSDRKVKQMLKNRRFCRCKSSMTIAQEDQTDRYGFKFKNQINYKEFTGDMCNIEAFYANKKQSYKFKEEKYKLLLKEQLDDAILDMNEQECF